MCMIFLIQSETQIKKSIYKTDSSTLWPQLPTTTTRKKEEEEQNNEQLQEQNASFPLPPPSPPTSLQKDGELGNLYIKDYLTPKQLSGNMLQTVSVTVSSHPQRTDLYLLYFYSRPK